MALKIDKVEDNENVGGLGALFSAVQDNDPTPTSKKDDKKKKNTPPQSASLATILTSIRKDKGDKVVIKAKDIAPVERIPTGIFELDFFLGGGFPRGRYSIIWGPESSGKTNLALKAISQAQKLPPPCNKAIFINVEQTCDPIWAAKMGVDIDELMVVNPAYGEEAVDLIDALIRADDVAILVVDSIAALISSKEIAKSVEEFDVGTSAMLIKRLVNKMMVAFGEEAKRGHFPCVIFINQRRFSPGVMFGDPQKMPGGEAQRFLASLILYTYGKNVIDKASNMSVFKHIDVTVKKSKIPIRAMSFELDMCMHPFNGLDVGETDSFGAVKKHLLDIGIMEKKPKGYVIEGELEDTVIAGITTKANKYWNTLGDIQDQYREDKAFALRLQTLVNDAYKEMILVEEKSEGPVKSESGDAYVVGDMV